MEAATPLSCLLLFLLASFCQPGQLKLVSQAGYERYNDITSIDETSCRNIEFHDYPDYAYYCDPKYDGDECEDDPVCHFSKLNVTLDEEGHYPGVERCCPFHGFIETATCEGIEKTGNRVVFGADVCLRHNGSWFTKLRPAKECDSNCRLVKGFLSDPGVSILGTTLIYNRKEFSDFCLGLRCDNYGERFAHWFEACGDCKNIVTDDNTVTGKNTSVINSIHLFPFSVFYVLRSLL